MLSRYLSIPLFSDISQPVVHCILAISITTSLKTIVGGLVGVNNGTIEYTTGVAVKGNITLINNLLMSLAEEQIKAAFLQSEKEVADLMGISQSYISRLEKKIMKKMKKEIMSKTG